MELTTLTASVARGRELDPDEIGAAARALADASCSADQKAALLEALAQRGETPSELAGFAREFRTLARDPGLTEWAPQAIDVCGTGGDRSGTFNVSTTVALVLAAAGVPVIKHGNRSITSNCGSADLLEGLGIRLDADSATLARSMRELNFAFLFAPGYHPAFKEIVPVRKALAARGQRTMFNLLGPLLNPARPAFQIVGVFGAPFVSPVAQALDSLGLAAGLVVHSIGSDGRAYDELTVVGQNHAVGFGKLQDVELNFDGSEMGLTPGDPAELAGGDVNANVVILHTMLRGAGARSLADSIALNAGAALHVVGRAPTIRDGIAAAKDVLDSGALEAWLTRAREFYQA